jgi:hypothetical protein
MSRIIAIAVIAAAFAAAGSAWAATISSPAMLGAVSPTAAPPPPKSTGSSSTTRPPTGTKAQPGGSAPPTAADSASLGRPDWSQFWPTMVATFFGAGLGLGSALYVESRLARKGRQEQMRQRREDYAFALELLADELRRNMALLRDMVSDLERETVTDRSPVRDVWRSLSTDALAAMRKPGTGEAVLLAYTRLARIEQRTQLYLEEVRAGGRAFSHALEQTLPRLRALIENGLSELDQAHQSVQDELNWFAGATSSPT